ncbi:MAG: response regulator transcription factor [Burkholderiaceae bacterium]|nr:response regulator transcription factor [Burkholderiaceae bacterium]
MTLNTKSELTPVPGESIAPCPGLKILLVEDHYLVREGLKLAIMQMDRQSTVLEAESVAEAAEFYLVNPDIDLVLLDLGLPGTTGMGSLELLYQSCPDARVVVISGTHDLKTVRSALKRGILGFIPKLSASASLANALRFVLNGDIYVPPEVFIDDYQEEESALAPAPVAVLPGRSKASTPKDAGLTTRQIEVLRLLLEGRSNKQICRELELAMGTVKSHVAAILQVLGATSRSQAVASIEDLGWRSIIQEGRKSGAL